LTQTKLKKKIENPEKNVLLKFDHKLLGTNYTSFLIPIALQPNGIFEIKK